MDYLAQALDQSFGEATILLYSPRVGPAPTEDNELADRAFCFY